MADTKLYMIFYDRVYRAQDNAEHLCRWVMKNHSEIKVAYILNSDSYDWNRLKKEGFNLIDGKDKKKVKSELKLCTHACSSIFTEGTGIDFTDCTCKRVFLNHGCFLVPISYIKAEHDNVDLFIAANNTEYNALLDPYHELTKDQVALCGQPRQDELVKAQLADHVEDSILIQFWQRPKAWTKENNKKFLESDFYKKTSALLTNQKLLKTCKEYGLKLVFKMHSIQYDWLQYYKKFENDYVRLSPLSELFEPEFIRSKMIITDISSNAYEMAKIGKPCLYFEPDAEELFTWRFKKNGGWEFDLDRHSIGPVIYGSVERAVNEICNMIKNNFKLDRQFEARRAREISFLNDSDNCKRCFEAIMAIKKSRTAKHTAQAWINKARDKKDSSCGRPNTFLYF